MHCLQLAIMYTDHSSVPHISLPIQAKPRGVLSVFPKRDWWIWLQNRWHWSEQCGCDHDQEDFSFSPPIRSMSIEWNRSPLSFSYAGSCSSSSGSRPTLPLSPTRTSKTRPPFSRPDSSCSSGKVMRISGTSSGVRGVRGELLVKEDFSS